MLFGALLRWIWKLIHPRSIIRRVLTASLHLQVLEDRCVPSDASVFPMLTGERADPNAGFLANTFGGVPIASSGLTFDYTSAVTHSGTGGFVIQTNQPIPANTGAFVEMSFGGVHAPVDGQPYVDTRDLTPFTRTDFWLKNTTGSAFSLLYELKDASDSNNQRAIWTQPISSVNVWSEVSIPLDLSASGWTVSGHPDLSRARFFALTIQADQGVAVSGDVFLDDMTVTERGGPLDSQTAPINDLVDRVDKQQFDALWGLRDRDNGLLPALNVYADQMALNSTSGLIKMLPGAIQRGWVSAADAETEVLLVVNTLNRVMNTMQASGNGGYLPPRYLDRVTLRPLGDEEPSVDAAILSLSLYQYWAQPWVQASTQNTISTFLDRFAWDAFSSPAGWLQAYRYSSHSFTAEVYTGYSGEIWTISLAAHLTQGAHHVDIATNYNTGTDRTRTSLGNSPTYLVNSSTDFRPPFVQWLFSLFVDVSQRGVDTYQANPANAANAYANAVRYQKDVDAFLASQNRPLFLQPDAGDDGSGGNYRQFSVFNDFGQPNLFSPWAGSFVFLADPAAAGPLLRNALGNQLDGPLGLADSVQWPTGQAQPASVAARTDVWNLALSTMALLEYRYHDSQFLTALPEVQQALDEVFKDVKASQSSGVNVTEGGVEATYTLVLSSQPSGNVAITLTTDGQVRTLPASLTFTPANWNTPQTITVYAVDDAAVEGAHAGSIHHTIASTDPGYKGYTVPDVVANIADNDTALTPLEFIRAAADRYTRSDDNADFGQPMVPLYTDYQAGGTYGAIDSAVNVTLDGNDPEAARGASSLQMVWSGSGPNGYFQFGIGPNVANRPRDIPDFGQAHSVRFLAKGEIAGRQVQVNVFQTASGTGFQLAATQWFTLSTSFADYAVNLPAGLRPQELFSVQFLMDAAHDAGGGIVKLDDVHITTDGTDPLRLIQSYTAPPWAPTGSPISSPQGRDNAIYPNRSFLYDDALAIKALLTDSDPASVQTARDIANAILATAPNGQNGYANTWNSGHILLGDGSVRPPFSQLRTLGDNSWFALALLDLYQITAEPTYLTRAREISDWAEASLKATDDLKGYTGGFDDAGNPLPWRATEHNIDFFALNTLLAKLLTRIGDPAASTYAARATYAGDFVIAMFDAAGGKFWTGTTGANPDQINMTSVPLDVQLWSWLTLAQSPQYADALDWSRPIAYAETNLVSTDGAVTGFTFSSQATPNRVWLEGVGQGLVVYQLLSDSAKAEQARKALQLASVGGGVLATTSDSLSDPALGAIYDARLAVAPTAWSLLGQTAHNPFAALATVATVSPSATTITSAQFGSATFGLSVTYNQPMKTALAPALRFAPAVSSTLTFAQGSWNDGGIVYTAAYDVANSSVTAAGVSVVVSGAQAADGNTQVGFSQSNVFAINTVNPAIVAATPSVMTITDAQASRAAFKLALQYSVAMKTTIAPTIRFSPDVRTTLTFAAGSWNVTRTIYTAVYYVADSGVRVPNVALAISGAQSTTGIAQLAFNQGNGFAIDTTNPTVTSITPSVPTVADSQKGKATFKLAIQYSSAMNTALAPMIVLPPLVRTTLTFASGSWDETHTLYTAAYDVADAGVRVAAVAVTLSGARSATGNLQVARSQNAVFAIDTVNPIVTTITPSLPTITDAQTGSAKFKLAVQYNAAMNSTVVPTITFNPAVASTLTFASGGWNPARTVYTEIYDVSDANVIAPGIAVTVRGAQNVDGNVQVDKNQVNVFTIDMTNPTVTAITPGVATITDAQVGLRRFVMAIQYSTRMSILIAPDIRFNPEVNSTLTFAVGSWNPTRTVYNAVFSVADAGVSVPAIAIAIGSARSANGNMQVPLTSSAVFAIDTANPAVTSITPSAAVITDSLTGNGTFSLAIQYSAAMKTTVTPLLRFAPAVNTTLALQSGSWDGTHTIYTAVYNVADVGVRVPNVTVTVSGARNTDGNLQVNRGPAVVFAIDTLSSSALSVSPLAEVFWRIET